jgi:hypothetical protein
VSARRVAGESDDPAGYLHRDVGLTDVRCPLELRFHVAFYVTVCAHVMLPPDLDPHRVDRASMRIVSLRDRL